MIAQIKGKVVGSDDNILIIENNGIGYEVICTHSTVWNLQNKTEDVWLFTYLHVREDLIQLFGFATKEEKNMFLKLTSVSGIGPKMAITILSGISASDLAISIMSADIGMLTSIKGLGKKTAERIIVELREKVALTAEAVSTTDAFLRGMAYGKEQEDAVYALMALGINKTEATKMVNKNTEKGMTAEDIIKKSLKGMSK